MQLAFFHLRGDDKPAVLLHLLRSVVKPQDQTVVFVATKHHTEYLKEASSVWGCPACTPGCPGGPMPHFRPTWGLHLQDSPPLFSWVEGEIPKHVIVEVLHLPTPQKKGGVQGKLGVSGPWGPVLWLRVHGQVGSDLSCLLPSC